MGIQNGPTGSCRFSRQGINPQAESQSSLKAAILPPDLVPMLLLCVGMQPARSLRVPCVRVRHTGRRSPPSSGQALTKRGNESFPPDGVCNPVRKGRVRTVRIPRRCLCPMRARRQQCPLRFLACRILQCCGVLVANVPDADTEPYLLFLIQAVMRRYIQNGDTAHRGHPVDCGGRGADRLNAKRLFCQAYTDE